MKNITVFMLIIAITTGCNNTEQKAGENKPAEVELSRPSNNSKAFNDSFKKLLDSYYTLKDALVDYDTVKANGAALLLAGYADSLRIIDISHDSSGVVKETAKNYTGTIAGSALGFVGERDLLKKKKEFQMISDAMYDLVRTVKYDREKIYHQHCPMAINDTEEAYWLSNSGDVVNPYLGNKHPKYKDGMLACGDITDSLGFSK